KVTIAGETFVIPTPQIVDPETWERANEVINERSKIYDSANAARYPYGLKGHIVHRHPDGEDVPMKGENKLLGTGKYQRQYRCTYAVPPRSKDRWCPGTQSNGPRRTTVGAGRLEA